MEIMLKKVRETAVLPRYATAQSAGCDLCVCMSEPVTLCTGERKLLPTGIAVALPEGTAGFLFARSGLSCKHGIALSNGVGVIDSDYRGELCVSLWNAGTEPYTVMPGERVAQLVILPVLQAAFTLCDALPETARGKNGFGSTGK